LDQEEFQMETKPKNQVLPLAMAAVMTAVTCILAPISLPVGPVSFTLGYFAIFLTAYVLGWRLGTLSCAAYLLLGLVGMPVFSGFAGGLGRLAGPTGGFLIGYLPMALIVGLAADGTKNRALQFLGMVIGGAVCYAFGTAWYCVQAQADLRAALAACVLPFIPWDLLKAALALALGGVIQNRLAAAGLSFDK